MVNDNTKKPEAPERTDLHFGDGGLHVPFAEDGCVPVTYIRLDIHDAVVAERDAAVKRAEDMARGQPGVMMAMADLATLRESERDTARREVEEAKALAKRLADNLFDYVMEDDDPLRQLEDACRKAGVL